MLSGTGPIGLGCRVLDETGPWQRRTGRRMTGLPRTGLSSKDRFPNAKSFCPRWKALGDRSPRAGTGPSLRNQPSEGCLMDGKLRGLFAKWHYIEVSERVGEDGFSIRRAGAEKSPNQVLEGSLRPEELKRRARTTASGFLPSRHRQEVGGVHPEAVGLPFMS
uniref:Uncharacterized protein n=1 Tax=Ananas comosus var. bracteatus TaxID=296719 RepID=A0A6V7PGL5_ANACO|nr:unnamed protein product [Ananas comosus var. bracteatus]